MATKTKISKTVFFLLMTLFLALILFGIFYIDKASAEPTIKGSTLDDNAYWVSGRSDGSYAVAWGDYDNDGDEDLAIGNLGDNNVIYRNDNGTLTEEPVWEDEETQQELLDTEDIAFADIDQNGWLDLVVANGAWGAGYDALYYNFNGVISITADWTSSNSDQSIGLDLGDYDNDGDLDLVVANGGPSGGVDALYRNDDGIFTTNPVWQSLRNDACMDVAFIDVDGDDDLDLYFATSGSTDSKDTTRDYIYLYDEGLESGYGIIPDWYSDEDYWTTSVDVSDVDLDGDMDVVVANGYGNTHNVLLYENTGTELNSASVWEIGVDSLGITIDVSDFDNDNYEDIAIATEDDSVPNYVVKNYNGIFGNDFYWQSSEENRSYDCAWGDVNNDNYLDLAIANYKTGDNPGYDYVYLNVIEYGDWVVSGEEFVENRAIILSGNLTIENSGSLTLKNIFFIKVNSSYDGERSIVNSGKLSILNSKITAKNTSNEFKFLVNDMANFEMKNSELSYCGYTIGNDGRAGLTIKTNNAIIENSTLLNNFIGMYLYSANIKIANNTISSSQYDFYMISNSQLTTIATVFNGNNVYVSSNSKLIVKNFLEVLVQDVNAYPIKNAIVSVKDNGNEIYNETTDKYGLVSWLLITDRIYDGSSTATENETTVEVWYENFHFDNNPRNVSMENSHRETFTSEEEYIPEFDILILPIISLIALFLIRRRLRKKTKN